MKKSIIPLLAVLCFGCSNDFSDSSIDVLRSEKEDSVERVDKSWVLIFSDEFNIDGAVDSKKWNYTPRGDVAHAYYYKPNDTSVVWCEDGLLNLKFMKDETDPRGYKSGSIRTDSGKFDFTYGKVEIKAKFSSGNGSWPAIWMMPASSEYGGWPASGEIDIMEHIKDLDVAVQTVHTTGTEQKTYPFGHSGSKFKQGEWNIWGIEWNDKKIDFMVNGEVCATYYNKGLGAVQWPFDIPFFLILNVAGGKGMAGPINEKHLPFTMQVDYVRVYQWK